MRHLIDSFRVLVISLGTFFGSDCDADVRGFAGDTVQTPQTAEGIVGLVVDSSGKPVVGAGVQAEATGENRPPIPEIAIVTDRNGRYAWKLPAGEYAITVVAEGFETSRKRARVEPGQRVILDFVLSRLEPGD
jgi:hypothetical protein